MTAVPFTVGFATPADVPDLMRMIRALADYERLAHLVVADESMLASALFGAAPGRRGADCAGSRGTADRGRFCPVFPHFLDVSRPARPVARGSFRRARRPRPRHRAPAADGTGRAGPRARLRTLRVVGPRLERAGDRVLRADGRDAAARLADRPRHRRGARAVRARRILLTLPPGAQQMRRGGRPAPDEPGALYAPTRRV